MLAQGDRRAGPSFSEFNYESTWGQRALKATYAAIMMVCAHFMSESSHYALLEKSSVPLMPCTVRSCSMGFQQLPIAEREVHPQHIAW